jgi:hypothetical protein
MNCPWREAAISGGADALLAQALAQQCKRMPAQRSPIVA